jgi:4-amino-4-deoxy-L-arabinose transferase-like glycosyltransferase
VALVEDDSALHAGRVGSAASEGETALRAGLAAIAALILLRFVLAGTANLAEDEAYYWLWSTHLATGYYDHPPMIAYWIRAGTAIFGQTEFGVRFLGLLSAIGGSYLLFRTSLSLFGDRNAAWLCVFWMNATLFCNAGAIVATPDTPLGFFSTAALFALAKLIETERGEWWYGIGASLGLAFMSKYTAALLLPGLFLWMIASAEGRRWFLRPEPYIGAVIALLIITPVVHWNYAHDWASFAKQAEHSIKDIPANASVSVAEFFGGQAGLATPLIFLFCLFGSGYALVRGFQQGEARWLLLGSMTAPILAFFSVHAASQKIQPNWPGLVYPAAILAAVHAARTLPVQKSAPRWLSAAFRLAPWIGIAFTSAAFFQLGPGLLPMNAKKDPTSRLKGWSQLGGDIERLRQDHGAGMVLTDRYAITGELAFYGGGPDGVAQINERIRYASLPNPDGSKLKNTPALLVLRKDGDATSVAASFGDSHRIATLTREAGFHPYDSYDVYFVNGYRGGLFGCGSASNQGSECN